MVIKNISAGVVHPLPDDLKEIFSSHKHKDLLSLWEGLTPLGRNEYICWVTSAKKDETREKGVNWLCSDLKQRKKRPAGRAVRTGAIKRKNE